MGGRPVRGARRPGEERGRRWDRSPPTASAGRRRCSSRSRVPRTSMRCARRVRRQPERIGEDGFPVFVIGRGSNLLVADAGFEGLVLRLGAGFSHIVLPEPGRSPGLEGPAIVTAGAVGRPAGLGAPGGGCRMERIVVGRRRAGLGRRCGADERRRPRFGHGVPRGSLPLGRPPQRRRRDGRGARSSRTAIARPR